MKQLVKRVVARKGVLVPPNVVVDDLENVLWRVRAARDKLDGEINKVTKVEEWNVLNEHMKRMESVISILEAAQVLMNMQ